MLSVALIKNSYSPSLPFDATPLRVKVDALNYRKFGTNFPGASLTMIVRGSPSGSTNASFGSEKEKNKVATASNLVSGTLFT